MQLVHEMLAGQGRIKRAVENLPDGIRTVTESEAPRAARIPSQQLVAELEGAGYALAREHGFLPNQYFLVFTYRP